MEATFGYDPDDPWAVRACFREPLGRLVAWDLSRELLRSGTYGLSGEGEVRLWPLRSGGRHEYVRMRLGRDGACALVDVDRADLRSWLRETYDVVPDGYEADRIDWKTERARLFTEE
ncbi:SsgA family sporulation/cell division regulator [Streptomyces sp. NPDC050848]|uniref:SsgA family sporulation/cell division regulator n=1 Tax=Streptomyces sp. NPDC050848 TaxID=3155791 RepID=UPI0033F4FB25